MSLARRGFTLPTKRAVHPNLEEHRSVNVPDFEKRFDRKQLIGLFEKQESPFLIGLSWQQNHQSIDNNFVAVDHWWGTYTLAKIVRQYRPENTSPKSVMDTDIVLCGNGYLPLNWAISSLKPLQNLQTNMLRQSVNIRQIYIMIASERLGKFFQVFEEDTGGSQ